MQKLVNVYSLRDTKTQIYDVPTYFRTHGEAERWLNDLVHNNERNLISKHPEDFDLFHLGTYDMDTAILKTLETPTHIVKALHLKIENKQ